MPTRQQVLDRKGMPSRPKFPVPGFCPMLPSTCTNFVPQFMCSAVLAATLLLVFILVHHSIVGSYMIYNKAAGSPGDRGYSILTGLSLPTLAIFQGLYNILKESKAAAFNTDHYRWYNMFLRLQAYVLPGPVVPHTHWQEHVQLFLGSLVGGYPAAIACGDLDPWWFLLDAHVVPQTVMYIVSIDVVSVIFQFKRPFLALVSDGYAFRGAILLVYSLVKQAVRGWHTYRLCLPL